MKEMKTQSSNSYKEKNAKMKNGNLLSLYLGETGMKQKWEFENHFPMHFLFNASSLNFWRKRNQKVMTSLF